MNKDKSILIKVDLNNFKEYAQAITKFDSDVNLYYTDKKYYDAKSVMSFFVFNVGKPRYVEIVSDDENEIDSFLSVMKQFTYNEIN